MMVEDALEQGQADSLRVVVSSTEALDDLRAFFAERGLTIETDRIGDDYHIHVDLSSQGAS